jgi:hypothetical protein
MDLVALESHSVATKPLPLTHPHDSHLPFYYSALRVLYDLCSPLFCLSPPLFKFCGLICKFPVPVLTCFNPSFSLGGPGTSEKDQVV